MDETDALSLAERVIEKIMARQHPGRPAFYALGEAHRAVRRARDDLDPSRFAGLAREPIQTS